MPLLLMSIAFYILSILFSFLSYRLLWAKKFSLVFILFGLLLYTIYVGMLALKLKSLPFSDHYGFYSLLGSLGILLVLLISLKSQQLKEFTTFYSIVGALSSLLALPAEPSPYRNPLYSLHIASALLSYIYAFFGGFCSVVRLLVESKLKHRSLRGFFMPISLLRNGERLFVSLAFVFLTSTLILGSLWSRSYFGKHWITDPKLLSTLFLWTYYAIVVHLNLLGKIRPKNLSYTIIVGMFISLLNLIFIRHEV